MRPSTESFTQKFAPLAAALLIGLAWSLPLLDSRYLPLHDTLFLVESFHTVYSRLLHHHAFPQWIATLDYGAPSTIQFLSVMAPTRSFTAALGLLFGAQDALFLVKVSFLLDQAVLTIGMWLTAREVLRRPGAVFLTALSAAFIGQPWLLQHQFSLGIVHLLPLQLFLVVRGCRRRNMGFLLAALSLAPFGHYMVGLHLLLQFIVFMFARRAYAWPWRDVLKLNVGRAAGMALLSAWAAVFAGYYWHITQTSLFLHGQEGRIGPFVPLTEFLTYSSDLIRQPRWLNLLGGVMDFTRVRVTGYVGWLPPAALVYAVIKVRSPLFLGFGAAALAVLGISSGGMIAALSYLFPAMAFARHIGHVGGVIQVMLILCAGFGLDRFLRVADLIAKRRGKLRWDWTLGWTRSSWLIAAILAVYAVDCVGAYMIHTFVLPLAANADSARWTWPVAYALRITAYAALGLWLHRRFKSPTPPGNPALIGALGLALMLDIGPFHALERHMHPALAPDEQARIVEIFNAKSPRFQPQRVETTREQADRLKYFDLPILNGGALRADGDVRYASHHAALNLDSCRHAWDALLISKNIAIMLDVMGLKAQEHPDFDRSFAALPEQDRQILGCGRSKLRLIAYEHGAAVQTPAQAIKAFSARDGSGSVVLRSPQNSRAQPLAEDEAAALLLTAPPADQATARLQSFREDRFFEKRITAPFALDMHFSRPFQPQSYVMRSGSYGADSRDRMPQAWRVMGSRDGSEWHEIAQMRETRPWRNGETREYSIDSAAAYSRYRLIVDGVSSGDVLRLNQFTLSARPTSPPKPPEMPLLPAPAGKILEPSAFDSDHLTVPVSVENSRGAWLVYADAYNPYWHARLDGAESDLYEADLGFKAVFVPAGPHQIEFYYDDPTARTLFWCLVLFPFMFPLIPAWLGRRA